MAKQVLEVERHPLGKATFRYTDTQGVTHQYSGAWDDTTPWESGTFNLNYRHRKGELPNQSFQIPEGEIPERIAIQVHYGNNPTYSEGCLVVDQNFLNTIYQDLNAPPFGPQEQPEAPLMLKVTGDFPARLQLSASAPMVKEGEPMPMQAGIILHDEPYPFSKDIYVRIGTINTSHAQHPTPAHLGQEETPLNVESGGWVKIPAGQSLTPFHMPIGAGTEKIKIIDYRIHNPGRDEPPKAAKDYIDNRRVLLEGAAHSVTLAKPTEADWRTRFKDFAHDEGATYLKVVQETKRQDASRTPKR